MGERVGELIRSLAFRIRNDERIFESGLLDKLLLNFKPVAVLVLDLYLDDAFLLRFFQQTKN